VATLPGTAMPGTQRLTWNGLSSNGTPAPAGLYFVHLQAGTRSAVKRLVKIGS
jgi:hypothetical protein